MQRDRGSASRRDLTADAVTIGEMFSQNRRFFTPLVQRAYAWGPAEAGQLAADIFTALDDAAYREREAPAYFLGSVVLVRGVGDDGVDVVDGQQRLTTLTIMLAILRDLDEDGPERLGPMIFRGDQRACAPHQTIFNPRRLDAGFFYERIQTPGATRSLDEEVDVDNSAQAKLLAVALHLRDVLSQMERQERVWFAEFLLRRCVVIEVIAPHQDQADAIFLGMNLRGKDPRSSDNLKAEVIGRAPHNRQLDLCDAWEALEAELGETDFVQLFSHIRMVHRPGRAAKSVEAELREILRPADDPVRFVTEELAPNGRILRDLLAARLPAGAQGKNVATYLRALGRLPSRDWAPPALAFLASAERSPSDKRAFLQALERLAYSFLLAAADDVTRLHRYAKTIKAIRDPDPAERTLDKILARMALTDTEKRIMRSVLGGKIFEKDHACKPVLLRLDEALADSSEALYDYPEITVEHVLPLNPPEKSPWRESFPNPNDRKHWTNRLGNLALLPRRRNNAAANLPFDRKKREYFMKDGVAHFALTTMILSEPEWTVEALERRQRRLLDTAYDVWDIWPKSND